MPSIPPEVVLALLGGFVLAYGISLIIRAGSARRGPRARCPDCRRTRPATDAPCACGHTPPQRRRGAAAWRIAGAIVACVGLVLAGASIALYESLAQERSFSHSPMGLVVGPLTALGLGVSAFGLCIAFVAFRGQPAKGRRRCPKCWYLIDAALGLKCSECGHQAKHERDLLRRRRRWGLAVLGLAIALLGQIGWLETRVRRGGWVAAVPTEVLILALPWIPEEWIEQNWNAPSYPDEDWTLDGRLNEYAEGHAWAWHRRFAIWRARTMLSRGASLESASRAALTLQRLDDDGVLGSDDETARRRAAELLRIVVANIESTDPDDADAADFLFDVAIYSPREELEVWTAIVSPHTAEVLATARDPAHPQQDIAVILLAYADPLPEVVESLTALVRDGHATAASPLLSLVQRSPLARDAAIELLQTLPFESRRRVAMMFAIHRPDDPAIIATLLNMLASDDPDDYIAAAWALHRYPDHIETSRARILELIDRDPESSVELTRLFRRYDTDLSAHIESFTRRSNSPVIEHRSAAIAYFELLLFSPDLAEPTHQRVLDRLRDMAANDPDSGVRHDASSTLDDFIRRQDL
ncbi:MAG: hypothetical protein H6809_01650 [Phycisphaeraceae bacterium]|nr:hypothetical protein [Phycisphaeraceae bacterium]